MKIKVLLYLFLLCICAGAGSARSEEKVLYMYNWSEYMPQEVLSRFTEETGINVVYSTYESNEAMYAKLALTDGEGYDLIVPSGYFVTLMAKQGMLQKIDSTRLSNYSKLDKTLFGNNPEYSIPYCWGSILMLVNSNHVDVNSVTSWNDFFKPEFEGEIILLDDIRAVFSIALLALGYSINTHDEAEIAEAYQWLKKLKPAVKAFNSEIVKPAFANEDVVAGIIFNGDVTQLNTDIPELVPVFPAEGVALWVDCLVIPTRAKNVENAYKFIDFLLRPEINKLIIDEFYYSTPNTETFKLLSKELQENKAVNPSKKDLGSSEFIDDVGPALSIYEKYWELLKTE